MWVAAKPDCRSSSSPIPIDGRVACAGRVVSVLAAVSGDVRPQHTVKVLFGDQKLFALRQELACAGPWTAEHDELEGEEPRPDGTEESAKIREGRAEPPPEDGVERNGDGEHLLYLIAAVFQHSHE